MRFGCLDLVFAIGCVALGVFVGGKAMGTIPDLSPAARFFGGLCCGLGLYLLLMDPVYRGLGWYPLLVPRCPCCRNFQTSYAYRCAVWPRVIFQCPQCAGEFVIWFRGRPDARETWQTPVLMLTWPYAFGWYKPVRKSQAGSSGSVNSRKTTAH